MDEQAVSNLHGWAQSKGYPGSVEEFSVLLQSDDGALQSAYSYAQEQGFPGDISAFENLVGRKKKDATESVSDDGLLESLQPEVAVSESVSVQAPPEPIEQLDETPTRVFGEEVVEEQVEGTPVGQSTAVKMPGAPEPVLDLSTGDAEFDKAIEFVDASLVDRGDEGQVARELSVEFKDFGFDFETTGIGDAIKVTARNGETMDVDLDPAWYNFGVDEGEEAKSLRTFLTDNKDTSELVDAEDAFKEAEIVYGEYMAEEAELFAEFEANAANMKALPKDDVEGYNKLIEKQDELLARAQKLVRERADSEDLYRESYANLERLSKPKEKLTALERLFGRGSLTNWTSDLSVRAKDQGLAQGATIRPNLNLAINGNNVTDEELEDFRRALAASAEAGPSDEMQELGRIVDKKSEGLSYAGKMLVALSETAKRPQLLPELVVSSVAMMANKEVAEGALAGGGLGAGGALLYGQLGPQVALPEELFTVPASFLTGAAGGAATTLETGLSFAEFMMEELAEKQGVDINEVDMSNESLREVLSDNEAMSRLRNRSAGRGVAMGIFNMVTKNVASFVTRRVVGKTGSKLKGILAAGAVDAPLEGAGEAIGRVAGRQEMTPLELVLETAAVGPGAVIGVAEGLIRAPKYTLNGESVGGRELARFIREADEADVAGATIEIKNDKVLAGLANDKRNTARERQIIGKQLRESGITDDAKVQTLTDLELEKRKLKGNETTSGKKKAERIQREIDATLDGDSYFFEEETDEQGNTISKEVRVTRREAIDALKDDDIVNPTDKEIEAKQAELFRDAMAEIGREDAIQEPSTEEVDVGEQPADGEEVGVGDTEEQVVAEEEAVVDEEAEELAERLEAEGTPDVTEEVAENVTAERKQGTTLGKKQQRIVEQAKKRAASLANSVSGLKVKLYETTDQYQKATNKTGKGVYLREVDEQGNVIAKTIHINLETANSRTVAHEAFHAMFLENLSEEETQAQAKALMATVRKSVAGDSALAKRIDQFLAAYNEAEIDEEALSEIFGYISNGYGELTAPEQSKVKAVIKALIERVTGIKLESGWSEGDQNVLDLFNTLAEKLEAGEEITAEEVGGLRVSEERVAEVEADTEIDTRIAAAQQKLADANEAIGTVLGELSSLLDEVDDEAAGKLLASVKKTISAKQVGATVKKIRDVKKSKRMSADDKAEALTKLEAKLDGQLEVLEKARDGVQEEVDSAVERVKAKAEKQRAETKKTERLAQIKDEGKAITKERSKAISKAKKEFEGEDLKTAIELIEEETKAKRDKLKAEKTELEKKPVKETPVEEVAETAEAEQAELKAAAERAKQAAEEVEKETVDEKPTKRERTGDGEYIIRHRGGDFVIRKTDEGYYVGYQTDNPDETTDGNNFGETFRTIKEAIEYADRDFERFGGPVEPTVEEEVTPEAAVEEAPAVEEKPTVSEAEKRAAIDDITVEEAEKRMAREAAEAKLNVARTEQRKLDALKGKTDKKSVAERKNIKQFIEDLKTMSVEEARAKRAPKPREQRVAANEYDLKSLKKVGEGSTRVVYDLGDGRVLKRAKNPRGLMQNDAIMWGDKNEILLELLPEVYFDEEGADYVIHESVPRNDSAVRKFLKPLKDVYDENRIPGDRYIHPKVMRQMEEMGLGEFLNYDLLMGDFVRPSSWGQRENGEFVLIDDGTLNRAALEYKFGKLLPVPKAYQESWAEVKATPKAREQRVADVVERYEFRPNGSLKESSLAGELRRNLKRYGFGVKQFGTRMDEFHIVNLETGRKVDPKKLIAKDRADEKVEMEQRAQVRESEAKESIARAEAEEAVEQELQQYRDQYLDFPEDMIPPSTLSAREQRESLSGAGKDLSTAALVRFAKERGYSNKAILSLRPNAQQAIDKYDEQLGRVNKEIQAIIQRTRERARGDKAIQAIDNKGARTRAINDRIEEDVLAYMQGTKFYKNASDVGREAMVRAVRKQMGRRIKSAPSVIKLGIKDGIPTIDKADLNYQLKKMAESSRLTALAMREAMREIGKDIAKLESAGLLTKKQALQIIKKLSKTDPLNPVQVENFVNFAARVFSDADYTAEVARMNKLRKRAFTNAEKKLGIPKDFMPMLRTLLAMDAGMIPDVAFEDYVKLVEMLGERKAELDLEDVNMVGDVVARVMNAVDEELSLKEELLARYVNYPNKKKGYKSTIKAMVDDGELSAESELDADGNKMPSEADILLKYINELDEAEEGKTEEQKELDRDKEKVMLLTAIEALPNLGRVLPTREERTLAKRFDRLIRTEAVNKLSNAELKNVLRVASNIENGFLSHNAQVLVEKMEAEQRAREVEQAIREADIPKRKLDYAKVAKLFGGPNSTLELIKRNPLRYIDQALGNFKSNRVYDAVFKPLAKAYSQYNAEMITIQERLDAVQAKLVAKHKRNPNAVTRSKFLIGAYMMQREYENNIGVDGVFSAEDLLQATIDGSGVGNAYYTGATTQMLQDILDKDVRGKTADEIEAALSPEEKAVAKEIRAINDELTPKAQYVAGVLRGVPFRPFSQYFHRIVLSDKQKAGMSGMQGLIEQVNTNMRPSTRAKNLEIRTGSIAPVNFDPFASANRGAKFILTDYYMTDPVRTAGRMANDLKKVKFESEQERSLVDAIAGGDGAINTAITDVLMQSYTINTWVGKSLEFVKRQTYRMVLADGPRFIAELLSNLAFVGFANPSGFVEGTRVMRDIKGMEDYSGVDVLRNVNSVQTTRLFPKPDTISSRMVDSLRTSLGPDQSRVTGEVMNNLKQIYAQTGKRLQDSKLTSQLADWMITTPDKMVTQPVWFGVFSQKFKEQTGEDVDFTKLAENDEAYMNKYEQAIKDATDAADDASVRTGATDNVFLGILRGTVRPDDDGVKRWFAVANSYMTRFLIFEYATARTAIQAAIGNGTISRGEGRRLIMATTARMVLYSFIVDILRRELDKAFGLGDDDDDIGNSLGNAFASAIASMVIGRTSGQVGRGLKGMAVEYLNEDFLYPGDYDPYGDVILDPLVRLGGDKRAMPDKELFDLSVGLSGPYGAPIRTGRLGYKLAREEKKKTGSAQDRREAEFNRLYLELAGMFGYVPIYKDLRRIYIKEIYKDLD